MVKRQPLYARRRIANNSSVTRCKSLSLLSTFAGERRPTSTWTSTSTTFRHPTPYTRLLHVSPGHIERPPVGGAGPRHQRDVDPAGAEPRRRRLSARDRPASAGHHPRRQWRPRRADEQVADHQHTHGHWLLGPHAARAVQARRLESGAGLQGRSTQYVFLLSFFLLPSDHQSTTTTAPRTSAWRSATPSTRRSAPPPALRGLGRRMRRWTRRCRGPSWTFPTGRMR